MQQEKRKGVIGIENEVKIYGPDGRLINFENLLARIDVPFIKQSDEGIWWEGGYIYEDYNQHLKGKKREKSKLIEFSTHPVEIRKGCVTKLADIIAFNLALLANMSDGLNISGYRRQYSINVDSFIEDVDLGRAKALIPIHPNVRSSYDGKRVYRFNKFQVDISRIALNTIGPVLVLLFGNRGERRLTLSPYYLGLSQKNKLEFDTEFLVEPHQLKAALAFLLGCEKGIERLIKETLMDYSRGNIIEDYKRMPLNKVYKRMPFVITNAKIIPGPLKASLRVDGYDQDVQAFGSKTLLNVEAGSRQYTLSCQDILKEYFGFFEEDIAKLATSQEARLLQKYIDGKSRIRWPVRNFCIDVSSPRIDTAIFRDLYKKDPSELLDNYTPRGMTLLYADAVKQKEKVVSKSRREKVIRETIVKQTKKQMPDWDGVSFRLSLVYDNKKRIARIYVPRDRYADYFSLERIAKEPRYFFEKAKEMFK